MMALILRLSVIDKPTGDMTRIILDKHLTVVICQKLSAKALFIPGMKGIGKTVKK